MSANKFYRTTGAELVKRQMLFSLLISMKQVSYEIREFTVLSFY